MAKISTYPIATPVVDADKWIGTDASNYDQTKNFTAEDVAIYLNDYNKIQADSLRYVYQNWVTGDVRKSGSISFAASAVGDNVSFSAVTGFMLSKYTKAVVDVSTFYSVPLVGSQVIITQCTNVSQFGIYGWDTAVQNGSETNFWDIGLTYVTGNGTLDNTVDYFISLLTYNTGGSADKNYTETFGAPLLVWTVNHNLNKKPSVSSIDTSGTEIYGEVEYVTDNQVTITYLTATGGTVTCN